MILATSRPHGEAPDSTPHYCLDNNGSLWGLIKLRVSGSRDLRKECSWPSTRALVRLLLDSLKLLYLVPSLGSRAAETPSISAGRDPTSTAVVNGLTEKAQRRRKVAPRNSIIFLRLHTCNSA